jgi:hypothetical protein
VKSLVNSGKHEETLGKLVSYEMGNLYKKDMESSGND